MKIQLDRGTFGRFLWDRASLRLDSAKRPLNQYFAPILLWVGVLFFCCSPGFADELSSYKGFIDELDISKLSSVSRAVDEYRSLFGKKASASQKDKAFLAFRDFYYEVNDAELSGASPRELQLAGKLLLVSEGAAYLAEDPTFLIKTFSPFISQSLKIFLSIRQQEIVDGFASDAALQVSLDNIGDRVMTWDKYIREYPKSPLLNEAVDYRNLYLRTFVAGMDNSPIYDRENKKITSEAKVAYEKFIKKYQGTQYGKLISGLYDKIRKCHFRLCPEVNKYLSQNIVDSLGPVEIN